jgi:hypothetical protein
VSAASTADSMQAAAQQNPTSRMGAEAALLQEVLARFGRARSGRENDVDDNALDESLDDVERVARRLSIEQLEIVKKARSVLHDIGTLGPRPWKR